MAISTQPHADLGDDDGPVDWRPRRKRLVWFWRAFFIFWILFGLILEVGDALFGD